MQNRLKSLSIYSFVISILALIIVNWYFPNYGILAMFLFLTIGVVIDQIRRILYPTICVDSIDRYRMNRILKTVTLVLLLQSPMAILYGNRMVDNLGTGIGVGMIGIAIIFDQVARIRFNYKIVSEPLGKEA